MQIKDLRLQRLAKVQYRTASEVCEENLLGVFLPDLYVGILIGTGIAEADLHVGIGNLAVGHYHEILENLHVALVRVHDHVQILIRAKHLGKHIAERLFKHTDHSGLVDIFQFFEFGKTLHHIGSFFFFSHNCGVMGLFEFY